MEVKRVSSSLDTPRLEQLQGTERVIVRFDFEQFLTEVLVDTVGEDGEKKQIPFTKREVFSKEIEFESKPSLQDIKNTIEKYYNDLCNEEILSGLKYQGYTVWLTTENQFNYKGAFDFCFQEFVLGNSYETPEFKMDDNGVPVYVTFETLAELGDFVRLCRDHIQNTLKKYWITKDAIDWTQYKLN